MVSQRFDLPVALLAGGRSEPYLVAEERVPEFRKHATPAGATWREADVSDASGGGGVTDGPKSILPFPD